MKNKTEQQLNVSAFALASGVIGFILSLLMGSMVGNYGIGMMGGMMGYGFQSIGGGFNILMGIWMAIISGIVGGAFAWVYNSLIERAA